MVVYVFQFPMNQINDVVINQDNSTEINISNLFIHFKPDQEVTFVKNQRLYMIEQ